MDVDKEEAHPGEETGELQQQRRVFRPRSPLRVYLLLKHPSRMSVATVFYLNQVLTWLKETVSAERLYDDKNPSMVLCDPELESAIEVRVLHLTEMREKVCAQLVPIDSPLAATEYPAQPTRPPEQSLHPILLHRPLRAAGSPKPVGIHERPSLIGPSSNRPIGLHERFRVKRPFLELIRTLPTVSAEQEIFRYDELSKFLSQYILERKDLFFDNRNIKCVVCNGDALGRAFDVRAFHRSQVMTLLRTQLIPLTPEEQQQANLIDL